MGTRKSGLNCTLVNTGPHASPDGEVPLSKASKWG